MTIQRRISYLALVAALGGMTPAYSQAVTPPASEETITLSEFNVSESSENRGYVASETMTGSRVATKIIDLPYTVNVLTSEFFEDFAVFELADNVTFIGSFTSLDIGGSFNLRGFGSTSQLRDGFYRLGRYGASNIDRMEIIKGSNAAIYGRSSPGGMVNMISKSPKNKESQKLTWQTGSFDQNRVTVEATGPFLTNRFGKTSYILTLSLLERGFDQEFARNRNKEGYFAIKHTFKDNSNLMLSAETLLQIRHAPPSSAQLITDARGTATTGDDLVVGYATALAKHNPGGPHSQLNRGNTSFTASYDKRFSPVWSVRAAANYYRARRWDFNAGGWGSITINPSSGAAPTSQRGNNPSFGRIMEDGGGFQGDVLAHYWLGNRAIENRTLMTVDVNDYYRWDPTWNYGNTATDPVLVAWNSVRTVTLDRNTLTPAAALQYFPTDWRWGGHVFNRLTRRRTTSFGGLLRHQSAFMQGRLLTYAGARFDIVRYRQRDFNPTTGIIAEKTVREVKPNFGANYKLTADGNLRAYVNYSESYFVDQTASPQDIANPEFKSEVADGYDYGFKGSLLNDRLTFTVGGFYANRHNVSVSDRFEEPEGSGTFVTRNRRDGDQLVRGWEADVNWRVSDEFSTGASLGSVNSIYTNFGSSNPQAKYRSVQGVTPQNGSAWIKYNPTSELLKGLSANLMVTYMSSTPSESASSGVQPSNPGTRPITWNTGQSFLRVPSYTLWNVGLHYNLRRGGRYDHKFSVNINNLFDEDYLKANKQLGDGRGVYFSYTLTRHGAAR